MVEEAFEFVHARGGVAFVVVAEVGVDVGDTAGAEAGDGFGPELEIGVLRALDVVEAGEVACAHEADVGEVGVHRFDGAEEVAAGDPLAFDKGYGNSVFVEQGERLVSEPTRVAKLDGEGQVAGQAREKSFEGAHVFRCGIKLRGQLDEHGGEFVLEEPGVVAKLGERFVAAFAQTEFVRDLLREFEGKGEARGRAFVPAVHGRGGGDGVEGGVNFDRVIGARVEVEHLGGARAARVEDRLVCGGTCHPVFVVPALTAEVRA